MPDSFQVIIDPNKKRAGPGEVLVGLGNTKTDNEGIVLQHKTQRKRYPSLSQYVYETDFPDLEYPQCCQKIYVEDFSVDTVLSLWIFFRKVHNETFPKGSQKWLDYANRWEQGDTSTTGEAFHSYGCLQNALDRVLDGSPAETRLSRSLKFLEYLIRNNINPSAIPSDLDNDLYQMAFQALKKEYAQYEKLLESSEIATLWLPMKESEGRKKVSAIFIETTSINSILKVFLRNDKEHAPTHDGFTLMTVYNPHTIGSGNDIVVSVDPAKNVHLRDLWKALEREEERLWQGTRPHDNPRPLASYPEGDGPNEPWWDDMGNYTLVAAPKMIGDQYGRLVSWAKVKEIIYTLYEEK